MTFSITILNIAIKYMMLSIITLDAECSDSVCHVYDNCCAFYCNSECCYAGRHDTLSFRPKTLFRLFRKVRNKRFGTYTLLSLSCSRLIVIRTDVIAPFTYVDIYPLMAHVSEGNLILFLSYEWL